MMETYHHLFPHPPASSLPCVLLHLPKLCLYNIPHPNFRLFLLILLHPLCNGEIMVELVWGSV